MTEPNKNNVSIIQLMSGLKEKDKEPHNIRVLNSWIARAANQLELDEVGRLEWIIATTVAAAKLQQVVDSHGKACFSIKGGMLLQYKLGLTSRATKDLDGIVKGDIGDFIERFDAIIDEPWGPIDFSRGEVEEIRVSTRVVKPKKFDLLLSIRGVVWRRIKIEISPDEGLAGSSQENLTPPLLSPFGIPTPDTLIGMAISYQIAQKIHASSMIHNPPQYRNVRVRDVADLVAIKHMIEAAETPTKSEISAAIRDVFASRAAEANFLSKTPMHWPVSLVAYEHWQEEYDSIAKAMGINVSLNEAIDEINNWIEEM